jgi:hypothetical protein
MEIPEDLLRGDEEAPPRLAQSASGSVAHASVHEEVNLEDNTGIRDDFPYWFLSGGHVQGELTISCVEKRAPNGPNTCPEGTVDVELHLFVAGEVLKDLSHSHPAVRQVTDLIGNQATGPYVSPSTLGIGLTVRRNRLLGRYKCLAPTRQPPLCQKQEGDVGEKRPPGQQGPRRRHLLFPA